MKNFRKKNEFDISKISKITIDCLKKSDLNIDILNIQRPSRNKLNIWNKIASAYFPRHDYKYKDILKIFSWWKRNTKNFRKKVEHNFSKFLMNDEIMEIDESSHKIEIVFMKEDLHILKDFVKTYYDRIQFNSNFSDYLSEKLQEKEINCWLKCKSNRFKKENSQKIKSPFWNGTYECIEENCKTNYKCYIENNSNFHQKFLSTNFSNDIILCVVFNKKPNHPKIFKVKRCTGDKRIIQSITVEAQGVANTIVDNTLFNSDNPSILGIFPLIDFFVFKKI